MALNASEKLEKLLQKEKGLKARIAATKRKVSEDVRKQDARRKILIGAMILELANSNDEYAEKVNRQLRNYLKTPRDRALFNLDRAEM